MGHEAPIATLNAVADCMNTHFDIYVTGVGNPRQMEVLKNELTNNGYRTVGQDQHARDKFAIEFAAPVGEVLEEEDAGKIAIAIAGAGMQLAQ